MIPAYDELYLSCAQRCLGSALAYAAQGLSIEPEGFYERFLASELSLEFALGSSRVIAGASGIELACAVVGVAPPGSAWCQGFERGIDYWTGWALAYYQWVSSLRFDQIEELVPYTEVRRLYDPYHEMDILQFVDKMDELCGTAMLTSNLKLARRRAGLTQKQLAVLSQVPLRTVQQYEQRQKDINRAQAATVISLATVLHCEPEALLEHIPRAGQRDYAWVRI